MVDSFHMTSYVLGAGASAHAGYPLCSRLWVEMTEWASKNNAEHSKSLEALQTTYGEVKDVEGMFTDLDLGRGAFSQIEEPQRAAWRQCIRTCLCDLFRSIRLQNAKAHLYAEFAKKMSRGDAVITFNYDVSLENELSRVGKFRVERGYGPKFEGVWRELPSDVTVFKLHGSMNWLGLLFGGAGHLHYGTFSNSMGARPYVDNHDGALSEYPSRAVLDLGFPGGGVVDGASLVLPTHKKRFFVTTSVGDEWSEFYASLWSEAQEVLLKSKRIVLIGYSMPEADERANELLLSGPHRSADLYLCCAAANERLAERFREGGFLSVHEVGSFEDWLSKT